MKKKNEWECPFCHSTSLFIDTPYTDRVTGEKETTYCCYKQKINATYARNRFGHDSNDIPTKDMVSKL